MTSCPEVAVSSSVWKASPTRALSPVPEVACIVACIGSPVVIGDNMDYLVHIGARQVIRDWTDQSMLFRLCSCKGPDSSLPPAISARPSDTQALNALITATSMRRARASLSVTRSHAGHYSRAAGLHIGMG